MQQGYETYVGGDEAAATQYTAEDNQTSILKTDPSADPSINDAEKVKTEVVSIMDGLTDTDKETMCKIFVGNIPRHIMDDEFKAFFEDKVPSIKDVFVMKDMQNTTQNRGFGFLSLDTIENVDALLMGTKLTFAGRPLDIKRASPKDCEDPLLHIKTNRIFLGGLTPNITEEDISDYYDKRFPPSGKPIEVIIKKDRVTNKPRGFCFVVFQNEHVVDKVMLLERKPTICGKRLDVRKADASGMNPGAARRGHAMQAAMNGYGPVNNFNNRRGRQMMNVPVNAGGMRGRPGYMNRGNFNGQMGAGMPMMPQQPQYQPYYNRNQYPGQPQVGGAAMGDPSNPMSMGAYGAPQQGMQQGMQTGHENMYANYMQPSAAAGVAAPQMSSVNPTQAAAPGSAYHSSSGQAGINQAPIPGQVIGTGVPPTGDPRAAGSYAQYIYQRSKQQTPQQNQF